MGESLSREANSFCESQEIFGYFMKREALVSYWQQFATYPYHKPDISIPPSKPIFLNPIFKSILKHRAFLLAPFLQVFFEIPVFFYILPICATSTIHLLLLNATTCIIFGE